MTQEIEVGAIVTPTTERMIMYGCQGVVWDVQPSDSTGHTVGIHFPNAKEWRLHGIGGRQFSRLGITYFKPGELRVDEWWVNPWYVSTDREKFKRASSLKLRERAELLLGRPLPNGVKLIPNQHPFLFYLPCEIHGCYHGALQTTIVLTEDTALEVHTCGAHYSQLHGKLTAKLPPLQLSRALLAPEIERTREKNAAWEREHPEALRL